MRDDYRMGEAQPTADSKRAGTSVRVLIALAILACVAVGINVPWSLSEAIRWSQSLCPWAAIVNRIAATIGVLWLSGSVLWDWWRDAADEAPQTPSWAKRFVGLSPLAFFLLVCGTVLLWRWPTLIHYSIGECDEGQSIAAGLTLLHDPRYFLSVDVGTHGPLIAYSQLLPRLLGMVPDFASARLVGLGIVLASLWSVLDMVRHFFRESTARLVVLPIVFYAAFMCYFSLTAYNGEHLPTLLCLLAASVALRSILARTETAPEIRMPRPRAALIVGLLLGSVVWAKLQGAPTAVVIGFFYIVGIAIAAKAGDKMAAAKAIAALFLGAIVPTVIALAFFAANHVVDYFWHAYVLMNVSYANRGNAVRGKDEHPAATWIFLAMKLSSYYWLATLLFTLAGALVLAGVLWQQRQARTSSDSGRRPSRGDAAGMLLIPTLVLLAAGIYAILKPNHAFPHYLHLIVFWIGLFYALIWGRLLDPNSLAFRALAPRTRALLAVSSIAVPLVLYASDRAGNGPRWQSFVVETPDNPRAVFFLRKIVSPGESMAVWGWAADYYVLSQAVQAVREGNASYAMVPGSETQPYFYKVFLEDMDKNRPSVFIDAVGPGQFIWDYRPYNAHEKFPELNQRIQERYKLVADVDGARIYVSNEKYRELTDGNESKSADSPRR